MFITCIDCEEYWDPDMQPSHCLCDDPGDDAWILFTEEEWNKKYPPQCNGICITGYEVGVYYPGIAYAHPECELHGEKW